MLKGVINTRVQSNVSLFNDGNNPAYKRVLPGFFMEVVLKNLYYIFVKIIVKHFKSIKKSK